MDRVEDLKLGMTVYFKNNETYITEGIASSYDCGEKVTGIILKGKLRDTYVPMDLIGIDIDWEKTRESNKDKDMKFTSCQNVDCNKESNCKEKQLIDAVQKAKLDGAIYGYIIDYHPFGIEVTVYKEQDLLFFKYRSIEHDADHCLALINSLYLNPKTDQDFNDLIDAAVQARKDRHIGVLTIDIGVLYFKYGGKERSFVDHNIADGIKFFESLYTETFVIDDIESLQKVKIDANGVLSNGSKFKVHRAHGQYSGKGKLYIEFESKDTSHASLEVLKGATVTQKRSTNE